MVSFNVATLAVSSGIAHKAAHALSGSQEHGILLLLALAACFCFTLNTLLVSGVLALVENKHLMEVWKQCYLWSFPYYVAGAIIAGLIVTCSQSLGWAAPLLMLPMMFMVYAFYRTCVQHLAPTTR